MSMNTKWGMIPNCYAYALEKARVDIGASKGLWAFVWARNLHDKGYFEQPLPACGNAGHYAGVLGDAGTVGITLRYNLQHVRTSASRDRHCASLSTSN